MVIVRSGTGVPGLGPLDCRIHKLIKVFFWYCYTCLIILTIPCID